MSRKEKVLVLASVASMIDQFNMPNIELLIEMGYEVQIACNFVKGNTCSKKKIEELKYNLEKLNVKIHQIDFERNVIRVLDNIKAYKQVKELASKNKYKFIHCHSPIGGVVGRLVGRTLGIKVIYTAHGFHFYKGAPLSNWLIYYPIERVLGRYTNTLITINKEDYILAKKKINAEKIVSIPGVGIDLKKFEDNKVDLDLDKGRLGLNQNSFIVLSIGELNKNKNHEVIIRSISKINNKEIHYLVCGRGGLEEELRVLSKKLNVEKQVHFLGFRDDIPKILRIANVFIFPSYREGLSVALMEAMAIGLPIICSNIRGNTDLIHHGDNGYLVEPSDIKGFSKNIEKLYYNPQLRIKMGKRNLEIIKKYDGNVVQTEMTKIYSAV